MYKVFFLNDTHSSHSFHEFLRLYPLALCGTYTYSRTIRVYYYVMLLLYTYLMMCPIHVYITSLYYIHTYVCYLYLWSRDHRWELTKLICEIILEPLSVFYCREITRIERTHRSNAWTSLCVKRPVRVGGQSERKHFLVRSSTHAI